MVATADRACPLLDHGEFVVLKQVMSLPILLQMMRF